MQALICKNCKYFAARTTDDHPNVKFLLYLCNMKNITFGVESDLIKKCPVKCSEKELIT